MVPLKSLFDRCILQSCKFVSKKALNTHSLRKYSSFNFVRSNLPNKNYKYQNFKSLTSSDRLSKAASQHEAQVLDNQRHLEVLKKHVKTKLHLDFSNWEQVQKAFTYHAPNLTSTNTILTRLGDKVLRFVLISELRTMEPKLASTSWFIPMNLRSLLRFERYRAIGSELNIMSFIRRNEQKEVKEGLLAYKAISSLIAVIYMEKGEVEARKFIKTTLLDNDVLTGCKYKPVVVKQEIKY